MCACESGAQTFVDQGCPRSDALCVCLCVLIQVPSVSGDDIWPCPPWRYLWWPINQFELFSLKNYSTRKKETWPNNKKSSSVITRQELVVKTLRLLLPHILALSLFLFWSGGIKMSCCCPLNRLASTWIRPNSRCISIMSIGMGIFKNATGQNTDVSSDRRFVGGQWTLKNNHTKWIVKSKWFHFLLPGGL